MIKLLQHVPVVRRMFSPTMTGFLLFSSLARSEESPIWVNAEVIETATSVLDTDTGLYTITTNGFDPDYSPKENLLDGSYKEIVLTDSEDANQFMTIDQGGSFKISRLFIQNRSDINTSTLGGLDICMGNDPTHPNAPGNVCLRSSFHEGGIFNL